MNSFVTFIILLIVLLIIGNWYSNSVEGFITYENENYQRPWDKTSNGRKIIRSRVDDYLPDNWSYRNWYNRTWNTPLDFFTYA